MANLSPGTNHRIGYDPAERVVLMENHDQAYHTWRNAGVKQRTLVHIDAHHDMWWVKEKISLNIANFICLAMKDDLVSRVFWVVPDASWDRRGRRVLRRYLRKIGKAYPGGPRRPEDRPGEIHLGVLGKTLRVCCLNSLPRIEEPVLLDIDTDYLVIPRVTYDDIDEQGSLPWCWPEELLARLRAREVRSDLVTIVYSVEGGYTPLKWKYLGDELALRLREPNGLGPASEGYGLIRLACEAAARGETSAGEERLQRAARCLPGCAAPHFHLAHLLLALNREDEAQRAYRHALEADPTYRTAYNSAGTAYLTSQRFRQAEEEHLRTLRLDPDDAYAHFGLGRLAARHKHWKEAETLFRKALALDRQMPDAHRGLGKALAKQGRLDEAIAAYERSLALALAGHRSVNAAIFTPTGERPPLDGSIPGVHERLGRLYTRKGKIPLAISSYRMCVAGGYDGVSLRVRLARLYSRQGKWKKAAVEAWRSVKLIPAELRGRVKDLTRTLARGLSEQARALLLGRLRKKSPRDSR
jgi:tetratricopeptide (TPR) repeat protein